jgi:hypothetical protein
MHATGRPGGWNYFSSFLPCVLSVDFRNGGHIDPNLYEDYDELVDDYGRKMAQKIIRFRLSTVDAMKTVAEEEDLVEHSQFRKTETMCVYRTQREWENAKVQMALFRKDMPKEAATMRQYNGTDVSGVGFSRLLSHRAYGIYEHLKVSSFESARLCHRCRVCGSPLSIYYGYTCSPTRTPCR